MVMKEFSRERARNQKKRFMITFIIGVVVAIFVGLWVAAGISEARRAIQMRKTSRKKPELWKVIIGLFIAFEGLIWRHTGIKLPMWRRRIVRRAKETQKLLNEEHGTFFEYPEKA